MKERARVHKPKPGEAEPEHRNRRQDPQPGIDKSHAWDRGKFPINETPFSPQVDRHAAALSKKGPKGQRADLVFQLQQTYGNRYVQRLIKSIGAVAKPAANAPADADNTVIQRATDVTTVTKAGKDEFTRWGGQIARDINAVYGITWPAELKRENGDIKATIWKHAGLKTGGQNVDTAATDENNWKAQISGLMSMGEKGEWYSQQAVEAHEAVHENRFKAGIQSLESKLKKMLNRGETAVEPASEYDMTNPLAYCRSQCNKIGKEDHSKGTTDEAELNVILPKIQAIWRNAVAIFKEKGKTPKREQKRAIKSGYQKKYRIPLPGRGNFLAWGAYKKIKKLKFKQNGTVETQ